MEASKQASTAPRHARYLGGTQNSQPACPASRHDLVLDVRSQACKVGLLKLVSRTKVVSQSVSQLAAPRSCCSVTPEITSIFGTACLSKLPVCVLVPV